MNALAESIKEQVLELARTKYAGFNHLHMSEMLRDEEKLAVGRSWVRRILLEAGIASPRKRRAAKHRSRRERYPKEGMLLQIDASPHHAWLEGRGPAMSLIAGIDDATGTVPFGLFRHREDSAGYFLLMRGIVTKKGCPVAIYRDRHSIFETSRREVPTLAEQLSGRREPTQFGRLLEELAITSIAARSPQAKGRIERLWETFQDRLTSEMRLQGDKRPGGSQPLPLGVPAPLQPPLRRACLRGRLGLPSTARGVRAGEGLLLQAHSDGGRRQRRELRPPPTPDPGRP